jgi:long-chain fatty acid transport protein
MRSFWKQVVLCALLLNASRQVARANPELPSMYDARAVGMGGTGTAFLGGPTGGVYMNPALLDGIEKAEFSLTVTPFIATLSAPLAEPGTAAPAQQTAMETAFFPLGLVAVGFRVHERITVGLGAYVASGLGAEYKDVSVLDAAGTPPAQRGEFNDLKLSLAVIEASLPVSVRLTSKLSIGAAWRIGYTMQTTQALAPNPAAAGLVNRVEQDLSGYSLLGLSAGVTYRPTKQLAFGASYRSKMTMDLEGETSMEANAAPPGVPTSVVANADTTSAWTTPHQLRLGSALWLLDEKLMLSLEGRVQLYKKANEKLTSTIDLRGQPLMALAMAPELEASQTLDWKNAYTAQLGAEYWVIPAIAVRLGFTAGNAATSERYPSPFMPPPGMMYTVSAGVGAKWNHFDAGLGAFVMRASEKLSSGDIAAGPGGVPVAPAGTYESTLYLIALSGSYRM